MKNKYKLFSKLLTGANCMALALVALTANSACLWIGHQPKFPEEARKFTR